MHIEGNSFAPPVRGETQRVCGFGPHHVCVKTKRGWVGWTKDLALVGSRIFSVIFFSRRSVAVYFLRGSRRCARRRLLISLLFV